MLDEDNKGDGRSKDDLLFFGLSSYMNSCVMIKRKKYRK